MNQSSNDFGRSRAFVMGQIDSIRDDARPGDVVIATLEARERRLALVDAAAAASLGQRIGLDESDLEKLQRRPPRGRWVLAIEADRSALLHLATG